MQKAVGGRSSQPKVSAKKHITTAPLKLRKQKGDLYDKHPFRLQKAHDPNQRPNHTPISRMYNRLGYGNHDAAKSGGTAQPATRTPKPHQTQNEHRPRNRKTPKSHSRKRAL